MEVEGLSVMQQEWLSRLQRFYSKYQPEKKGSIPALMNKNFDGLMTQLVKKYGPEPSKNEEIAESELSSEPEEVNQELLERIVKFYHHYNKAKIDSVESIVRRTRNNPKYERRLVKMLVAKYGPEPDLDEEDISATLTSLSLRTKLEGELDDSGLLRKVTYCPADGMPPEYCEYLSTFPTAFPWLLENYPDLVLATRNNKTVSQLNAEIEEEGVSLEEGIKSSSRGGAARPNKALKAKKSEGGQIVIETVSRGKRKHITQITGLDSYGDIQLKQAAKKLGKKFACSASVNKLPDGRQSVDLQGDCSFELPDVLLENFPSLTQEAIFFKKNGKKVSAF